MQIVVQKFGGTSVADIERIKSVATIVAKERALGNFPIVVVSAMAGVTNNLINLTDGVTKDSGDLSEHDSILASGEQVSAALVALSLRACGLKARSYLSWQLPILTDQLHGSAKIVRINKDAIEQSINNSEIPVIAGFQGVDSENRLTTLGRGGSDTTATAIAATFGASRCDIYTDVDGIFTADPRIVEMAKKLDRISYAEMLELASLGAKVLHPRSIEIAMKYRVPVRVLSSFTEADGTMLITENEPLEGKLITAITHSSNYARVSVLGVPLTTGSAVIFNLFAEHGVDVDMLSQSIAKNRDHVDLVFALQRPLLEKATKLLEGYKDLINYSSFEFDANLTRISIVGVGVKSNSNVIRDVLAVLYNKGIRVEMISISEIKISVLIASEYTELAIRALHTSFGLDK